MTGVRGGPSRSKQPSTGPNHILRHIAKKGPNGLTIGPIRPGVSFGPEDW
jgi:hypothetical protein